jgi:holo-[acyl-carrier protein] synthase
MASAGVGIGILGIARMDRALNRRPSLARRFFTDEERRSCERAPRPAEHYAARYAARVAVLKALGCITGADGVTRHDVSVGAGEGGRAVALLSGAVKKAAEERGVTEVALSLSFTHEVATAMALLVTDEVKPKPKEDRDPERELMVSFKQARTVLDELDRLQGDVAATME